MNEDVKTIVRVHWSQHEALLSRHFVLYRWGHQQLCSRRRLSSNQECAYSNVLLMVDRSISMLVVV